MVSRRPQPRRRTKHGLAAGGRRAGKGRGRGDRACRLGRDRAGRWDETALGRRRWPLGQDAASGGAGSLGQDTTALGPLGEGRSAGHVADDSARAAACGGAVAASG
jgi:hypothetical protein